MSDQEIHALHEKFEAVTAIRDNLSGLAGTEIVTDMAGRLISQADSELSRALEEIDDTTRTHFTSLYEAHVAQVDELTRTESTLRNIGSDIPVTLTNKLEEIQSRTEEDIDLQIAQRLLGISIASGVPTVAQTVARETIPQEPEVTGLSSLTPDSDETLKTPEVGPRSHVKVDVIKTEQGTMLRIAKRYIPLTSRKHAGQRDYSSERLAAVHFMLQNHDTPIAPRQMWQGIYEMFGEEVPSYDRGVMTEIRNFFKKAMYGNQQIIEHNGNTGLGSVYVVNPRLKKIPQTAIQLDDILELRQMQTQADVLESDTLQSVVATNSPKSAAWEVPNLDSEKIDQVEALLPTITELGLLIGLFDLRSNAFHTLLKDEMPNLVALIETAQRLGNKIESITPAELRADKLKEEEIIQLRLRAYEKMRRLFEDENLLNDALSVVSTYENQYGQFMYDIFDSLVDFSNDEWAELQLLVNAKFGNDVTIHAGSFGSGERIIAVNTTVDLADRPRVVITQGDEPVNISDEDTQEVTSHEEAETTQGKEVVTQEIGSVGITGATSGDVRPKRERSPRKQQDRKRIPRKTTQVTQKEETGLHNWEQEFDRAVGETISRLNEQHLIRRDTLTQKQLSYQAKSAKMGTNEAMERLLSASIISHEAMRTGELTAPQVIAMHMFNSHADIFRNKKRAKQAMARIEKDVEAFFIKQEK